jgi:hypothetical protein
MLDQAKTLAVVRWLLGIGAGYAVKDGIASASQAEQIVAGALALVAIGWSLWQKHEQQKAVAAALATPVASSPSLSVVGGGK